MVTDVGVTVTSGARHCGSVAAIWRLVLAVALGGAAACAGEAGVRRPEPPPPRRLTVLLQRGALASAALTGAPARGCRDPGELPDPLRSGAAQRYLDRALPVGQGGELAVARLGPAGRLVGTAVGDFSAPLVVVDDPGAGGAPEVLLAGGNVRLLARIPRRFLREVTTEGALLAAAPGAAGGAAIRLGPGLPVERLGSPWRPASASDPGTGAGELTWVRYRDPEVEAVGVIAAAHIGQVYRAAPAAALTPADADVPTPLVLLDAPRGRPFATIWRPAGPLIPAARQRRDRDYTLVRIDLSRDVTLTGWVRSPRAETIATDVRARPRPPAHGQWLSVAGLPGRGLSCVELPAGARLHEGAGGPVTGLVTRGDRFILLAGRRAGWVEVGVGHPFGLARLWIPDRDLHRMPCEPSGGQPGTT